MGEKDTNPAEQNHSRSSSYSVLSKLSDSKSTPYLIIFIFCLIYFSPYMLINKTIVPLQILQNNTAIQQEACYRLSVIILRDSADEYYDITHNRQVCFEKSN